VYREHYLRNLFAQPSFIYFQAFVEDPNGIELQKARLLLEKKKAKNFITTFTLMRIPNDFLFISNLSLIKHL
jgi:hypothetical protein